MTNVERAKKVIDSTKGRIFTATFIKKDGQKRTLNCRTGVRKFTKGGVSSSGHIPELVTVFDIQKQDYRNINLESIIEIRFGGETFNFNDEKSAMMGRRK